jgi:SnoaL-like protein
MTTTEIANRLVRMCRDGKIEEAKEELFAPTIVSIEPHEGLLPKEVKGMQAIRNKAHLFISHVENFFGQKISEPIIAGDFFAMSWDTDLQMKGEARKTNNELCLYQVKNGKIIAEQFFY